MSSSALRSCSLTGIFNVRLGTPDNLPASFGVSKFLGPNPVERRFNNSNILTFVNLSLQPNLDPWNIHIKAVRNAGPSFINTLHFSSLRKRLWPIPNLCLHLFKGMAAFIHSSSAIWHSHVRELVTNLLPPLFRFLIIRNAKVDFFARGLD